LDELLKKRDKRAAGDAEYETRQEPPEDVVLRAAGINSRELEPNKLELGK
jgi:hypothetical protein